MGRFGERGGVVASVGVISTVAIVSVALLYYRHRRRLSGPRFIKDEEEKPQKKFRCVLADRSFTPFVHLRSEESGSDHTHPYDGRLRAILDHPPVNFRFMQPGYEEPAGMQGPFEWIESEEQLEALAHALSKEMEFAVDTEQHSFHSFYGFTALVQISTKEKDYLVDSMALHDSMGVLRAVFANPAICKIFHGADNDVLWLQRDFHIYVVNMFDTAKACLILQKAQSSLAYLLQMYCGVDTNKAFQRADWRLRPLPKDMVQYARTDAHYLLYIARQLCAELLHDGLECALPVDVNAEGKFSGRLLEQAVYRSNLTCLQLYEKEGLSSSSTSAATTLLTRFYNGHLALPSQADDKLFKMVTGLCQWRDRVARLEDESLRSVLSDTALMALATSVCSTPEHIYETIAAADASLQVPELANTVLIPSYGPQSLCVERYITELLNVLEGSDTRGEILAQKKLGPVEYFYGFVEKAHSLFRLSGIVENDVGNQDKDASSARMWESNVPKRWRANPRKSRMNFVKKFSCKAPVYHNCRIYFGGRLLCFCERKKLDWYVQRGLAEAVPGEPLAVRLLFEPKGRPEDKGNDFYIQEKSNQCVGCGESSHYLRYRIIPSCYRQNFPEHLKSHRSHDVVLVCVDCHEIAHKAAEMHKRKISEEYGVPLLAKLVNTEGSSGEQAKSGFLSEGESGVSSELKAAAVTLLRHGPRLPDDRRQKFEAVVRGHYGRDNISKQDLRAILLLTMKPHELRRILRRYSSRGDSSGGANGLGPSASQIGNNEYPIIEAENCHLLQEDRESSSLSEVRQLIGRTSVVVLAQPGPTGAKYDASSENRNNDSFPDQHLEKHSLRLERKKPESQLGHGPHGRKVVEILMKQEGDDGILNFSQQWRRVFVDAVHPTYLPPGWDVLHSGRRDFGDFSVYKVPEGEQSCEGTAVLCTN